MSECVSSLVHGWLPRSPLLLVCLDARSQEMAGLLLRKHDVRRKFDLGGKRENLEKMLLALTAAPGGDERASGPRVAPDDAQAVRASAPDLPGRPRGATEPWYVPCRCGLAACGRAVCGARALFARDLLHCMEAMSAKGAAGGKGKSSSGGKGKPAEDVPLYRGKGALASAKSRGKGGEWPTQPGNIREPAGAETSA